MFDFNPALLQLWLSWLFLYVVFTGIGLFAYALFDVSRLERRELLLSFWVGLAASTVFLQVWHLVAPVNLTASLLLFGVSLAGLVRGRHEIVRILRALPREWAVVAVLLGLSVWVAGRAANAEMFIDDESYHVPDMLWTMSYAIVPGLGHIHGRLAFNNAFTLPLVAIDLVPFLPTVIRLGNGLLLVAFFGQALLSLKRLAVERAFEPQDVLLALVLVPVLNRINFASGVKNDLVVALVALQLGVLLLDALLRPSRSRRERTLRLVIATLLACFGIAVKLSAGVYGILALALLVVALLRQEPLWATRLRLLGVVALVVVGTLGVWALRGVILSGYPAYPLTVGALPVEWRIPLDQTQAEADLIYSWARDAYVPSEQVLSSWDWFGPWFDDFRRRTVDIVTPVVLLAVGVFVFVRSQWTANARRGLPCWLPLVVGLPGLAAVVFWFVTAPDVRFGWPFFWLLGASVFVLALWQAGRVAALRVVVLCLVILLSFDLILQSNGRYGHLRLIPFREDGQLEPIRQADNLRSFTSYHGVDILVPDDGYCVYTTLPCTHDPEPYLKLREPGNLGAGFVYEEVESDKGAFALRALNPADDIGPDAASAALHAGTLATDGLLVGNGWQALETAGDEQYRWVDNDAEIYVTAPTGAQTQLALDVEPGPSLGDGEHVVQLVDENDDVVAEAPLTGRGVITFELPLTDERVQIFRLRVASANVPAPNDGRILNLRVIGFDWAS